MHRGAGGDTLRAGSTVASPRAWPLLHVAPARNTAGAAPGATRQIFVSFEGPWRFGPMTASAPPCVGQLHGVLAVLRARAGRSRFHRACPMDATRSGMQRRYRRVLVRAYTVASPEGASEGGTGFPLGCDPGDAQGPAVDAPWPAPLSHPRKRGPCSELRRPLLHVPARGPNRRGRARENRSEPP